MGFEIREPTGTYASSALVVDNSVAMRWLISSGKPADRRYALSVRDYLNAEDRQGIVPYLWCYEAANVAAYYVRENELEYSTAVKTLHALHDLFSICIDRRETPLALFEAADAFGVTAYDAAYLLLARNAGLPLATLDKKMRSVAKRSGIQVF